MLYVRNVNNNNISYACYSMTTTKEAYKNSLESQNILSIERWIKYTHCQIDLKTNLAYKGVNVEAWSWIFKDLNLREENRTS